MTGLSPVDFQDPSSGFQFGLPPGQIDILLAISDVTFAQAWADSVPGVLADEIAVRFLSLAHLIRNKQAAGRLQDLADVEALEKARDYLLERELPIMSERQNFAGTSEYEDVIGFSRAVRVGRHIMVSGTGPVGCDDADVAGQADQCLTIIAGALKDAGSSFEHVVRTRIYLTAADDWEAVARVHGKFFKFIKPAATMVVVAGLLDPRWKVEIEADALLPEAS